LHDSRTPVSQKTPSDNSSALNITSPHCQYGFVQSRMHESLKHSHSVNAELVKSTVGYRKT